jgi:hypothetical protein
MRCNRPSRRGKTRAGRAAARTERAGQDPTVDRPNARQVQLLRTARPSDPLAIRCRADHHSESPRTALPGAPEELSTCSKAGDSFSSKRTAPSAAATSAPAETLDEIRVCATTSMILSAPIAGYRAQARRSVGRCSGSYSAKTSCNATSTADRVFAETVPSRLTKRSLSTVLI